MSAALPPASITAPPPLSRPARLRPKEHGAYAVLLIPLITSWIVAGPTRVGACVSIAAICGFLAHEPLLVVWGHRGGRQRQATPGATLHAVSLLGITVLAGVTAFALADLSVRAALIGALLLALFSFMVALRGQHRTLPGQILGVVGLTAPGVLILLAGGLEVSDSIGIGAIWLVGFFATTTAVHAVIAAQKRRSRRNHGGALTALSLVACLLIPLRPEWALSALPMIGASWYLLIWPPGAKHLKRVGWALVTATAGTALLIVLGSS